MRPTLVRDAALALDFGGLRPIVDPMLDGAGTRPLVTGTPNERRNPLVPLPGPIQALVEGLDGVLVMHLHADHLDDGAAALRPRGVPVFCQPED